MIDTKKLLDLIKEKGLKKSFIAEKLGISRNSLHKKANNITDFKGNEIKALCELLQMDAGQRDAIFFN